MTNTFLGAWPLSRSRRRGSRWKNTRARHDEREAFAEFRSRKEPALGHDVEVFVMTNTFSANAAGVAEPRRRDRSLEVPVGAARGVETCPGKCSSRRKVFP